MLQLSWRAYLEQTFRISILKNISLRKLLSKLILTRKQCARWSCFHHKWISFERYMCFFKSTEKVSLEKKRAYLDLGKHKLQEVFPSKIYSALTGKQCARCFCFVQMVFFWDIHVNVHLSWIGLFGTKWAFLVIENSDWQELFSQKLSQFSQGNNVLDAPASGTNGFLLRDTCISSTQLKRPIRNKHCLSPPWKTYVAGSIPFKNELSSHRETMWKMLLLLTEIDFFHEIHVFLHLS
jgi:hypothetical protein